MAQRTKTHAPSHVRKLVKNEGDRLGQPILAIVVHTTESADIPDSRRDLDGLYNWFNNPTSQASSHLGIDGDGNTYQFVLTNRKAWTVLSLNPVTFNIEFVARAGQKAEEWEDEQIRQGARWAAYVALKAGLPARKGAVRLINGQGVITRKGVLRHSDITKAGIGTHTDPGSTFPMKKFLRYMRYYMKNGWTLGN